MGAGRNLFHLGGCDSVAQDVTYVVGIPIEPFDFIHPILSIYGNRMYS